jgi:hypothetical protein
MTEVLAAAEITRMEREPGLLTGTPGVYLDFEIPAGSEVAAELLENRQKHIELVAFRQDSDTAPALATVFVPDAAADHFRNKIEEYRTQNTPPRKPKDPLAEPKPGRPKNEDLIARINGIRLAAIRSVFTDDPVLFPPPGQRIWWEVWIRQGYIEPFDTAARRLALPVQSHRLIFPDREVRLVYGDVEALGRLYLNSNSIAEVRRAKDTPALFVSWSNVEQADWADDLATRIVVPEERDVAVCVLDTGTTQAHPLLAPALDPNDVHKYHPNWADGDRHGHGTNMAGTALFGDLLPLL